MTYIPSLLNGVKSTNNSTTSNVGGQTTIINSNIASDSTTVDVSNSSVFDSGNTIKIDDEYLIITNISGSTLTISRGQYNSIAVGHDIGTAVVGVFIGTSEMNVQPDVITSLKSDVSGTEYFDFSNDGTNWDSFPINGFTISSNIHEFHSAVKGPRYFRIRFVNGTSNKTTSFRINTYYGVYRQGNLPLNQAISNDVDTTVTRSILVGQTNNNSFNNVGVSNDSLKVSIEEPLSAFGELKTSNAYPTVQLSFVYGINSQLVNTSISGIGTITASNSLASISSGSSSSSSAILYSKRFAKYKIGQGIQFKGTAVFTTGVSGNEQLFGVGNGENGFFFGYNSATFGILHRNNSVDSWIQQSSWNIDNMDGTGESGMILDQTKGNVYSINYQWLGFGCINFLIENQNTGKFVIVHRIKYPNTHTLPSLRQPSLPICISSQNTTNTSNIIINCGSVACFSEGSNSSHGSFYSVESSSITGVTSEVPILSVKVNTQINGINAYIPVIPKNLSLFAEGSSSKVVKFNIYLNPTLTGSSWTNIDSTTCVLSYDVSSTSFSGGTKIGAYGIDPNRSQQISNDYIELFTNDILLITCSCSSSVNPTITMVLLQQDSG
jgi:hypothetical protein